MESASQERRTSVSSRHSNISASVTVVNSSSTPNSPAAAQCAPHSPTSTSPTSSVSSISENLSDLPEEPELNPDPIQGWPQLSLLMAKTPDLAAFPRFRDLNVKSLLYYKCQLEILREKLHRLEYEDAAAGNEWDMYACDLMEATQSEQFKTIKEMRVVLKEYNDALLQYTQICALPDPEPFNMRTLRKWLRNEKCANFKVRNRHGADSTWGNIYSDPDENVGSIWKQFCRLVWGLVWTRSPPKGDSDLAVTAPQVKVDGLTRWVAIEFIPFRRAFIRWWKARKQKVHDVERKAAAKKAAAKKAAAEKAAADRGTPSVREVNKIKKQDTLVSWSENGALRLTSTISTLVACLMPVVAISVLSQLHGIKNLLLCLAGFSLLFALGLIFLTQGTSKRTEVFAATAAFSAVMVVFISVPPAPVIVVPPGSRVM